MRFENRVVVVTGSSIGIGFAIARRFALEGANVIINCRTASAGEAAVAAIEAEGGKVAFIRADVSKTDEAKHLIDETMARFGRIDILVNNAGIGLFGTVEEMDPETFFHLLSVNVGGVFLPSHFAIKPLRKTGQSPSIINIGSAVGLIGCGGSAGYCATKGAVANLTRAMAIDHAADGIRVNCICPGVVDTLFNDKILADAENPDAVLQAQKSGNLIGRLETPEDIASACLFLASEEASYITGSMFMIDGGVTAK